MPNNSAEMPRDFAAFDGLGDRFETLLREACGGRLGSIAWFRTDWQRGGAKTGRSTFRNDDGSEDSVVVKIPVGPDELLWNQRLQPRADDSHGVTARLYASGNGLGDYDFIWMVMERFPEGPLFGLKRPDAIELMADVAARFYRRTAEYPVSGRARVEDWPGLLDRARQRCADNRLPNEQRWRQAIRTVQKNLDALSQEWAARPIDDWCHGDLHPANAMSRSNRPDDPAMLIDLAEVRPGHWLEDAIYLERLYWVRRDWIRENPPVRLIGTRRRELGLSNGESAGRLADVRRVLLGATSPAFLRTEGNPVFLQSSLEILEETLERVI